MSRGRSEWDWWKNTAKQKPGEEEKENGEVYGKVEDEEEASGVLNKTRVAKRVQRSGSGERE